MGKSVIRELFTEISRFKEHHLTPPKRGIVESPPMRNNLCHYKTSPREKGDM